MVDLFGGLAGESLGGPFKPGITRSSFYTICTSGLSRLAVVSSNMFFELRRFLKELVGVSNPSNSGLSAVKYPPLLHSRELASLFSFLLYYMTLSVFWAPISSINSKIPPPSS